MHTADDLIERLGLQAHPEGGWYRETWRAIAAPGERPAGTSILFLLRRGETSHWHRVDADEVWLHQAGAPLLLDVASSSGTGPVVRHRLGVADDAVPQAVVPAGHWQSASPDGEWSLLGCVVAPGFEFRGFELAPQGWRPDRS